MQPLLDELESSGKVEIVCKADSTGWAPPEAQTATEQCLTKNGNDVDAIVAMNDSTGDGIWAALKKEGLNGKVPIVGGHDASLTGVQRVLAGDQVATFNFDAKAAGEAAAKLLAAAIAGESPDSTGLINFSFDNGFVEGGVPTAKAPENAVTPDTVQELVVDTEIFPKEEICKGIAADSEFCKS
jgi:D-xylose transport system substrate-binding protein